MLAFHLIRPPVQRELPWRRLATFSLHRCSVLSYNASPKHACTIIQLNSVETLPSLTCRVRSVASLPSVDLSNSGLSAVRTVVRQLAASTGFHTNECRQSSTVAVRPVERDVTSRTEKLPGGIEVVDVTLDQVEQNVKNQIKRSKTYTVSF